MLNAYFKEKSEIALPVLIGKKNATAISTHNTREAMLKDESFLFSFMIAYLLDNAASADLFTCVVTYNNKQTSHYGTEETYRCGETVVCTGAEGQVIYISL